MALDLLRAGIRRIVFVRSYPDPLAVELRTQAALSVERLPDAVLDAMAPCLE